MEEQYSIQLNLFLHVAKETACAAGNFLKNNFGTLLEYKTKESNHSIVTNFDIDAEKIIIDSLLDSFPNHKILSEESHASIEIKDEDYVWIVDPLDGTSYYARGIPTYSVSIALYHQNKIIVGVIYCPQSNELYWASELENHAFKNGNKIFASKTASLQNAIGSFSHRFVRLDEYRDKAKQYLQKISSVRAGGSCAMELALLAEGKIDLFIALNQKAWDFSAGKLIVEKSGGNFLFFEKQNTSLSETLNCPADIFAHNGFISDLYLK